MKAAAGLPLAGLLAEQERATQRRTETETRGPRRRVGAADQRRRGAAVPVRVVRGDALWR